ncbi:MAG TPA: cupin domain-containing protein [Rhizomicrobium sp.]|jgi:uncharacterized cupin superfamily protein
MPKIDVTSVPERKGSGYPAPFHEIAKERTRKPLGDAAGLTQFGVNLLSLPPDAGSSQRHWHSAEDEFVYVVSGELTLITDQGEEILRAGDCAGFPKNDGNGHQLINRSAAPATCLEIGTRSADDITMYSDLDMMIDKRVGKGFIHKDGTPYPRRER